MAYDRFCDIHVASGSSYHFTSEIVDYCKYQLETKRLNAVGKKSLLVLDYISDWQQSAIALLEGFEKAEIVFRGGAASVVRQIQTLLASLKPRMRPQEKIAVGSAGSLATLLKKLCGNDLFVDVKADDFKGSGFIIKPVAGGFSFSKPATGNDGQTLVFGGARNLDLLNDEIGYLGISVPMAEISGSIVDPEIGKMIAWIVAGGASKIRFNAHGDGEGNLQMAENIERVGLVNKHISADCIAAWLTANGLARAGNLKTISINICMAARHKLTPAVLNNGQYTPAEGLAVALLAGKLGELSVHGIKVTGSNEVVDSRVTAGGVRTPMSGQLGDTQPFRKISIPRGFAFDRATFTMTVPEGWTITDKIIHGSTLCAIKPPSNWTVRVISGDFTFEGSGKDYSISNAGWIVTTSTKEILSAEGWTRVDGRNMRFAGTGGVSMLEELEGKLTILERLAKSNAKAVAYS